MNDPHAKKLSDMTSAELRVRVVDLTAEIVRLKEWNQQRAGEFACTEQRLSTLIAYLSDDKDRLDWLGAHPLKAEVKGGSEDGHTGTFWGLGAHSGTLREAIDATRKAHA